MKYIVFTFSVLSTVGMARDTQLQNHNFAALNRGDSKLTLNIGYPGMGGKACGVELRASNQFGSSDGLEPLTKSLVVKEGFFEKEALELTASNGLTPQYVFPESSLHTYVTKVQIETLSGKSLDSVIRKNVKKSIKDDVEPQVIVQLIDCE
jgi:hypothetical protein